MTKSALGRDNLRSMVLRALYEFGCLACPHYELHAYIKAFYGEDIAQDEFDRLLRDERRAFAAEEQRDVWLCLGIGLDLHGDPDRWGRSDWDLYRRVLTPWSEQTRRLWVLRQFYSFVLLAGEDEAVDPLPLLEQFLERAKTLPASALEEVRRRAGNTATDIEKENLHVLGIVAEEQYDLVAQTQDELSEELVKSVRMLNPSAQLFGVAKPA